MTPLLANEIEVYQATQIQRTGMLIWLRAARSHEPFLDSAT